MSIQEFHRRYEGIEELEKIIVEQINGERSRYFADNGIFVPKQSEIGQKVSSYVSQLVAQFPTSFNGSRFISATITLCPKIVVRFSNLLALCEQERPGNLFYKEIGKYIDVAPLQHTLFGNFTDQQVRLELRDIHFPSGATFSKNDWTEERCLKERECIAINTTKTIGTVNIDSKLQKTQLVATIRFGTYEARDEILQAETLDGVTLDLVVNLPHLTKHAKIGYDGIAVFDTGHSIAIEQLIGSDSITWIQTNHQVSLEYDLRQT